MTETEHVENWSARAVNMLTPPIIDRAPGSETGLCRRACNALNRRRWTKASAGNAEDLPAPLLHLHGSRVYEDDLHGFCVDRVWVWFGGLKRGGSAD